MLGNKYLLLEINKDEAEFYHLPALVPYPRKEQKRLDTEGFSWEHSVKAMQDLLKKDPSEEYKLYRLFAKKWGYYQELDLSIQEGKWPDAEKIIDKILSVDLLDPSAYLNLGFIFRSQKKYREAIQAYTRGSELVNNRETFLIGLAKTYDEIGNQSEALYLWNQINSGEAAEKLIQAGVYKEIVEKTGEKTELIPGPEYQNLSLKEFQKFYNNPEKLTELGVRLVHYGFTELGRKVLERVYEMSCFVKPSS